MSVTARTGTHDGTGTRVVVVAAGTRSAVVADRARIRATTAWCSATGLAADAIAALDADEVVLDPATCARLADQLRRVGQVLRAVAVPALAWVDAAGTVQGGTLGRELAMPQGATLRGQSPRVLGHWVDDHAWLTIDDSPEAVSSWGPPHPSCDALAALTGLTSGNVMAVPATSVLAGLLTTARELAMVAARSAGTLRVSGAGRPD